MEREGLLFEEKKWKIELHVLCRCMCHFIVGVYATSSPQALVRSFYVHKNRDVGDVQSIQWVVLSRLISFSMFTRIFCLLETFLKGVF